MFVASPQQTTIYSEAPGTRERVECTETANCGNDIDLSLESVDIDTTEYHTNAIVAYHFGSEPSRSMAVPVGGSVNTSGAAARSIRVGIVNDNGGATHVVPVVAADYRQQTVTMGSRAKPLLADVVGVYRQDRLSFGVNALMGLRPVRTP